MMNSLRINQFEKLIILSLFIHWGKMFLELFYNKMVKDGLVNNVGNEYEILSYHCFLERFGWN